MKDDPRRSSAPRLTDAQWELLRPLFPAPSRRGRPRADDRQTVEAILYVLRTGCRWGDLPREYGSHVTAWRRLRRWEEEGVWEHVWRAALASLDEAERLCWETAYLDGSFAPAKKGAQQSALPARAKGPNGCS